MCMLPYKLVTGGNIGEHLHTYHSTQTQTYTYTLCSTVDAHTLKTGVLSQTSSIQRPLADSERPLTPYYHNKSWKDYCL